MEKMKSKKKISIMQVIPAIGILISLVFIYLGFTKYGFWDEFKGPKPGFFPIVVSIFMLVASLLSFFFSFKEKSVNWPLEDWILPLSVAGILIATFIIGLLPSLAIYVLLWLKKFEKCSWKTTLIVFGIIAAIVVGAFGMWLGVPFPKGIILNMISN